MADQTPPSRKKNHHRCACCGKTGFEFPDELMTPELQKLKATMSPEEFEELMKGLM